MIDKEACKEVQEKYGLDVHLGKKIVIPEKCPNTEKIFHSYTKELKRKWYGKEVTVSQVFKNSGDILIGFKETVEGHWDLKWVISDFAAKSLNKESKLKSNKDLLGL